METSARSILNLASVNFANQTHHDLGSITRYSSSHTQLNFPFIDAPLLSTSVGVPLSSSHSSPGDRTLYSKNSIISAATSNFLDEVDPSSTTSLYAAKSFISEVLTNLPIDVPYSGDQVTNLSHIIRDILNNHSLNSSNDNEGFLIDISNLVLSSSLESNGTTITRIVNNQTINGSSENDNVAVIGNTNVINADSGSDRLAVVGNSNTLNGGHGNDILAAVGNGNLLNGDADDDILKADGGTNTLVGGVGNDIFGLPDRFSSSFFSGTPGKSLIQDFEDGVDKLGLPTLTTFNGTSTTSRILNVTELAIAQQGQDTTISYQGDVLAVLQGIQVSQITEADFIDTSLLNTGTAIGG